MFRMALSEIRRKYNVWFHGHGAAFYSRRQSGCITTYGAVFMQTGMNYQEKFVVREHIIPGVHLVINTISTSVVVNEVLTNLLLIL